MKIEKMISITLILIGLMLLIPTTNIETVRTISGTSATLTRCDSISANLKRTDYRNSDGEIAFAEDKHYGSMVCRTDEKGRTIEEKYYDEKGEAVMQPGGYFALAREYNQAGQNITVKYLDARGLPIKNTSGYAILRRSYNPEGCIDTEYYYDEMGQPAELLQGQYGVKYLEYDAQGRATKLAYLNEEGKISFLTSGYAVVERLYDLDDHIIEQRYYDDDGCPTDSALGEYGVRYEDYTSFGDAGKMTYLDQNGNPLICNAGYATVLRYFADDRTLLTERYYDSYGNPVDVGGGRYGLQHQGEFVVTLNQNGKPVFRLDEFLLQHTYMVILFVGLFLLLLHKMNSPWEKHLMLAVSIAMILYMTLLNREVGEQTSQFQLLWSYRQFFSSEFLRGEIINNILLFIPFGACLRKVYPKKRGILISLLFSACIEAMQYLGGFGLCELDDIISNGLGGLIGYLLAI